jgi:hypothetical protein
MGIPSDRRFLAVANKRLRHLFPDLPQQSGYFKRRRPLAETLEWLMGVFASQSPGFDDDLLLIDSTPVECARSRETVKRAGNSCLAGAIADAADYGYCASHSRYFWGMRLHAIFSPDGTPRALELCSPKLGEREVGLVLIDRVRRHGPVIRRTRVRDPDRGAGRDVRPSAPRRRTGPRHAQHDHASAQTRTRDHSATPPDPSVPPDPTAAPRADPATDRIDLLDRQRHPHPRTPRRPDPPRPPRTSPGPLLLPRRRDRPQPPTPTPKPCTHQLLRLTARNQPSSVQLEDQFPGWRAWAGVSGYALTSPG